MKCQIFLKLKSQSDRIDITLRSIFVYLIGGRLIYLNVNVQKDVKMIVHFPYYLCLSIFLIIGAHKNRRPQEDAMLSRQC